MSLLNIYDEICNNRQEKIEKLASIQTVLDEVKVLDGAYEGLRGDAVELFKREGTTSVPSDGRGTLSFVSFTKREIPVKVAEDILDSETFKKIVVISQVEYAKFAAPKKKKGSPDE